LGFGVKVWATLLNEKERAEARPFDIEARSI
jgi:hypothetical protein